MKCQECGKKIDPSYLPSNYCKDCVEEYMDTVNNGNRIKAQIHPEFH